MSKPYRQVPIQECGEPLVPLPSDRLARFDPHPYASLGAPYGDRDPFWLRQGVCDRLLAAQTHLDRTHPGWRLLIFDALRPLAVQQFMVDYTFGQLVQQRGWDGDRLTPEQRQAVYTEVHEFWAMPDANPATPPPHSTGGAIDLTLLDAAGQVVDMGGAIDEISPRSHPDHYATPTDARSRQFHQHRTILVNAMTHAGFRQHPQEWWHFSYGDQLWAWLSQQADPQVPAIARYGRA